MNRFLAFVLCLYASVAQAAGPYIWFGDYSLNLPEGGTILSDVGDGFIYGSTQASGDLLLSSTIDSTVGFIKFGKNATTVYDETTDRLGIGSTAPAAPLVVNNTTEQARFGYDDSSYWSVATDLNGVGTLTPNGHGTKFNKVVGIGVYPATQDFLKIAGTTTGATDQSGINVSVTGSSGATGTLYGVKSKVTTATASHTVPLAAAFDAIDATKGSGSTITAQAGINIEDQTQGTVNYGIRSAVTSGSSKYNLYATGTAQNYMEGALGVGVGPPTTNVKLHVLSTTEQLRLAYDSGNYKSTTVSSAGDVTEEPTGVGTRFNKNLSLQTAPEAQTGFKFSPNPSGNATQSSIISSMVGSSIATSLTGISSQNTAPNGATGVTFSKAFVAKDSVEIGTGAITDNIGVDIENQTVGTNNYGLRSQVSSGANKYNLNITGTAMNTFAGLSGFNKTTPVANVDVVSATSSTVGLNVRGATSQSSNIVNIEDSGGTTLLGVTPSLGTAIKGTTSNNAAATGYVGEVLSQERLNSAAVSASTGTAGNVTANPITLTPGVWFISASVAFSPNAATSVTQYNMSISGTSASLANSATEAVPNGGGNNCQFRLGIGRPAEIPGAFGHHIVAPGYVCAVTTNTDIYLTYRTTFTINTMSVWGSFQALRIR